MPPARDNLYFCDVKRFLSRLCAALWAPVRREWVFILLVTLLLGVSCFNDLRDWTSHRNPDYMLLAVRGTLRALAEAYLLAAVVTATRLRRLRWIFLPLAAVLGLGAFTTWRMFGLDVSPLMLTLLAETDGAETAGFFRAFFGADMVLFAAGVVAVLILGWLGMRYQPRLTRLLRPRRRRARLAVKAALGLAVASGMWLLAASFSLLGAQNQEDLEALDERHVTYRSDIPVKIMFAVKAVRLVADDCAGWLGRVRRTLADPAAAVQTQPRDTMDIVVVIGESYARGHSQLYGYPLPTAPFQTAEARSGRLVAFDSVTSVSRHTSPAMRSVLSLGYSPGGEGWQTSPYVPALFSRAGWHVYMLDNQRSADSQIYSFTLNSFLYPRLLTDSCYAYVSEHTSPADDLDFISRENPATVAGASRAVRRLWIYHLWGQHHPASDRYPAPAARFTPADYGFRTEPWLDMERRKTIADYDNATLYNDSVVARIVSYHAARPSAVIYFSDHGEEVYDFRDVYGRGGAVERSQRYVDALYGVPFMIWTSDSFRDRYPGIQAAIAGASSRVGTTDLLGYTLLRLAGITVPGAPATRDILSPDYIPARGMTLRTLDSAD